MKPPALLQVEVRRFKVESDDLWRAEAEDTVVRVFEIVSDTIVDRIKDRIIESETEWTVSTKSPSMSFRIWKGVIYRKEVNEQYYMSGFRVLYLPLAGRGLVVAQEWVDEYGLARRGVSSCG